MNIVKSIILFIISIILIACVIFLFIKIPDFIIEQQAIAIVGISFIGVGATISLGWSIAYLISDDFK